MALNIDLTGKIVLVTGVSSGIGAGVAEAFARAGAHVAGCARSDADNPNAKQFVASVEKHGTEALYLRTDITLKAEREDLVQRIIDRFGRLDVVVSSAGMNVFKGVAECSTEDWDYNLRLNLESHWHLAQLCRPHLEKTHGVIEIMTSNHAYASLPGCFPYNVTKTALTGLVRSITLEWSPAIRCVGIAPGFIYTDGCQKWFDQYPDPAEARTRIEALHPAGKIGSVGDVGAWCVFLASDYASFAAGTTYLLDGGRSAVMQDFDL